MRLRSIPSVAVLLAGSVLVTPAPAAQAAPVFTDEFTSFSGFGSAHDFAGGACTVGNEVKSFPTVPVVENGPAVTATASISATDTAADPEDVMRVAASVTATGSVSSVNGSLKAIDFSASGQLALTSRQAQSACLLSVDARIDLDTEFAVTRPGFLTVSMKGTGQLRTDMSIEMVSPTSGPFYEDSNESTDVTHTARIFLPVGVYQSLVTAADPGLVGSSAVSLAGTSSLHAAFSAVGSQTAAPAGKGAKYLTLPTARSCATHALDATVTGNKRTAKKIKLVKIFVNDTLATKAKLPGKGKSITVSVADDTVAEVTAQVTLFPAKPGRKAKVHEVSAGYEACTS